MKNFFTFETASGLALIIALILGLLAANTSLSYWYQDLLNVEVQVRMGSFDIHKPLLLWVNDGLMAIFFLLVGLEIKREVTVGELNTPNKIVFPLIAAVGGMLIPALIYSLLNNSDAAAMNGWAIPTATDIAFALGLLALLGKRVPLVLKVFLLALAIIDDLGAIIIIALFYTSELSIVSLVVAGAALLTLIILNRLGVKLLGVYMLVGTVMWVAVLKSGVHATLAGVALALCLPSKFKDGSDGFVESVEHAIQPYVAFFILPLFAFVNTGIDFSLFTLNDVFSPIAVGVALGLFIGKPLGVLLFAWLAVKFKLAKLPEGVNWLQLTGVGILCGVGLTMSLFIGALAFSEGADTSILYIDRVGILMGSLLSAVVGVFWLHKTLPAKAK